MRNDVAFCDAATLPGAAYFCRVEFFFGGHSLDRRRKDLRIGRASASRFGNRRSFVRRSRLGFAGSSRLVIDYGHHFADFYVLAFVDLRLEHAGFFGRDFGRNFVRLESEERLAGLDVFARFLVPDGDDTALD